MSTRDEPWPHGTPAWVDVMVDDVDAAREFYGQVFGWDFQDGPPEAGGYLIAQLQDRPVAGVGPKPPGAPFPSVWSTYLAVDDLDETISKVEDNAGRVMMGPMDVMEEGRMAIATDPAGAVVGMWQPKNHIGARLVNEPNALIWNECMTRDYAAAKSFYASVFGYSFEEVGDDSFSYAMFRVGDNVAGGIGELPAEAPADTPPHWMAYFAVTDPDQTVAKATDLGAKVLQEPHDTPYGRMALLQGPQEELFSVISAPDEAA
jgi:predicted enzyme related to lactoylglutathione lyase